MTEQENKESPLNEVCEYLGSSCTSKEAYTHPESCSIVRKFVRMMVQNQQDLDPKLAKLINDNFWGLT